MSRNGDGLFRRSGIWYFKYRDYSGKYREKSTGKRKQPDARDWKHEFLEQLRNHQLPTDEAKWTLSRALAQWLEYRAATRPKSSVAAERTSARHLEEILGGGRRLNSITAWDLRHYQMSRMKQVGPKTINNEMLVLVAQLKNAKLWHRLKEDFEPLQVPKGGPGMALNPEDLRRLIEVAQRQDRWHVALCATVLAYATGCRKGEITKLQLGDLHLDSDHPFVRLRAATTKSRKERDAALNSLGLWAVNRLRERAQALGATKPDHFLLPGDLSKHTKPGDPLRFLEGFDVTRHQASWDTAWESVRKAAGLPGLRFHDLRHTHITHAIEEGSPIEVVMAQVGHISAEMTRHYTHIASRKKHDAVDAVARRSGLSFPACYENSKTAGDSVPQG